VLLVAAVPDAAVVVEVAGRALTSSELRERGAALPGASLHPLPRGAGGTRAFLHDVLIPELLLEQHASSVTLPAHRRDQALAFALEARLARSVAVSDDEVAQFFAEHRERFNTPAAVALWRILTDSEEEAREILEQVRGKATGAELWSSLARERSLDAATKMRRGDLGFVHADGRTDVPQVRVNPAVFQAAAALQDGELAPAPIRDGNHFAALWRRGNRAATEVSLASARDEIRRVLLRERSELALTSLVARLRDEHVSLYAREVIESVDYGQPATTKSRRPLVQRAAAGAPVPSKTLTGER
jgi:peptidyl-prolyl cis-trans isomerase C